MVAFSPLDRTFTFRSLPPIDTLVERCCAQLLTAHEQKWPRELDFLHVIAQRHRASTGDYEHRYAEVKTSRAAQKKASDQDF
jgi:hypothetical protein